MRIRRGFLALLLGVALVECRSYIDESLAKIPEGAVFTPVAEAGEFQVEAELSLWPHPDQAGAGKGSLSVRIASASGQKVNNLRTAVIFPDEMVEAELLHQPHLVDRTSRDLSPERPGFGLGQVFAFPDWGQVEGVKAAALHPIRLRLAWNGGERFLEIPPSAITVKQEDPDRGE